MPACWATSADPTSRALRNRPPPTPGRRRGRRTTRPGCSRTPPMFPMTRSASSCFPVTNSTPCVRWDSSRASSGPHFPDGSADQPSYLGTVVHKLPAVGSRSNPDLTAIRAAKPDLILGSQGLDPEAVSGVGRHRADGVHRVTRGGVAGQPTWGRRSDRTERRRRRSDRPLHHQGPRRRRRARRRPLPGVGRAIHRECGAHLRGRQLPGQRIDCGRRGSSCGATVYRQALCRGG